MSTPEIPGLMPAPTLAEALRPHVERSLAARSAGLVTDVVKEVFKEHIPGELEAVELLVDFEDDLNKAVRSIVTPELCEEAIAEAIADLLYPPEPEEPELYFATLGEFVEKYVVRVYRRPMRGSSHIWCPRWFEHEPAVVALQVLWTAFETYRRDPGIGPLAFHRDGLLPVMNALTHPEGPLAGCSVQHGHNKPLAPLPCEPIPEGLFDPTPAEVQGMPTAPPAPQLQPAAEAAA